MAESPQSLDNVHPGVAMVQKWIRDLPAKTGHSFEDWLELIRTSGPATGKVRCVWLKTEHKLGQASPGASATGLCGTLSGLGAQVRFPLVGGG